MEEDYKLAKWLNNELSEEELIEFKKNPDYSLYEKIKVASSRLKSPDFDHDKMLANILSNKKEPKVLSFKSNWVFRIAAVFVISLGLFITYQSNNITYYATNNNLQIITLPDNSEVEINNNAKIQYQKWFWKNNREIELDGEAYFKVAKGKTFEVNTDLGKVAVLGTQFNVYAHQDKFEVTCFEGKVKVNYKNQEIILTKGMVVTFEKNIKTEGKTALAKPTWISNKAEMSFTKQSLQTIIAQIEKTYNVSIDANSIETEQLFTGTLPNDNLDIALQIISSTYHLQIKKSSETSFELEKE